LTTRVAFTFCGADGWTGGLNYQRNLLSALAEHAPGRVTPLLFTAPGTPGREHAELHPYLAQPPVVVPGWARSGPRRWQRLWFSSVLQRDRVSERVFADHGVDVVFVHAAWYGLRFGLPTLAWIADFQHRHLPHMFSWANRTRRDLGYAALGLAADSVMLSSEDAARDCQRFYPRAAARRFVLPFAVQVPAVAQQPSTIEVVQRYDLPRRFFYMPNQLWKHKNHMRVVQALQALRESDPDLTVVASGNPSDIRNPQHPQQVLDHVRELGLERQFRFLGLVPYADLMPLMRASIAVLNPSLFEGWSTTVEEAKALGVPLLLSDLRVHREQTTAYGARFFAPDDTAQLATLLAQAWRASTTSPADPGTSNESCAEAAARYQPLRRDFAYRFAAHVEELAALRRR